MSLKRLFAASYAKFQSIPLFLRILLILELVMIALIPLSKTIGLQDEGFIRYDQMYFDLTKTDLLTMVKDTMIIAPIKEEVKYRGPAWLTLMLLLGLAKLAKRSGNPQPWTEKILFCLRGKSVTIYHILILLLVWPIIITSAIIWMQGHNYPMPVFLIGLIFGWFLIKTRSLLHVILLHIVWNGLSFIPIVMH